MEDNYEEIVLKWYNKLRPKYMGCLVKEYPNLELEDVENLYQDTFMAVQKNILEGRVQENTSWSSYIIQIGLNMASKFSKRGRKVKHVGGDLKDPQNPSFKIEDKLAIKNFFSSYKENEYRMEKVALLNDEIHRLVWPCDVIIKLFYYEEKSMVEIAEETGFKNADTVKSKKSQCMKHFLEHARKVFRAAGFDEVKDRKKK